jgi:hypothetical protein
MNSIHYELGGGVMDRVVSQLLAEMDEMVITFYSIHYEICLFLVF